MRLCTMISVIRETDIIIKLLIWRFKRLCHSEIGTYVDTQIWNSTPISCATYCCGYIFSLRDSV